jgi:hypothetical protein
MTEMLRLFEGWLPEGVQTLLLILVKITLIVVPLLLVVAYLTFAERKVIGYIQVRMGPNRVGPQDAVERGDCARGGQSLSVRIRARNLVDRCLGGMGCNPV